MKIGLLLPSVFMSASYRKKIFAPKQLFLQLAEGLVKRGHKVYMYSIKNLTTKATVIGGPDYLVKHKLPSIKFREGGKNIKQKLADQLTRNEFELATTVQAYIHGQKVGLDIMHSYHDFMAHYISKLVKYPTVYSLHDPPYPPETMEAWRLEQFANDLYIPLSINHKMSFGGKVKFTDVVYHGLNLDSYKFNAHINSQKSYLAFMGRYIKEKGLVEAINTAMKLHIPLHIAGDKAYRKLVYYRKYIKPLLSEGHVKEIGFMDGEAKSKFLGEARALLFPIKWEEPFGMVMIEAMACGTPVIAYNRGSVSEIVRDGVTGFIVNPPSSDLRVSNWQLTGDSTKKWIIKKRGIEGLIEAVKHIGEIDRQMCRKHVEENFTVEKMVEGYIRVYKKVIKASRS